MRQKRGTIIILATALALGAALRAAAAQEAERPDPAGGRGLKPFAELSAGPLIGLDRPLRGAAAGLLVGLGISPFEIGARAAGAYDSGLKVWDARFDLELGLGGGLRAIVGGLILPGSPALEDSSGNEAAVRAAPRDWPNRFGIAVALAELLPRRGARGRGEAAVPWPAPSLGLDAELVYASYRVEAENALSGARSLSGAAAFAAGVEARVMLVLRWGPRRARP
jgi:hypothetical protein